MKAGDNRPLNEVILNVRNNEGCSVLAWSLFSDASSFRLQRWVAVCQCRTVCMDVWQLKQTSHYSSLPLRSVPQFPLVDCNQIIIGIFGSRQEVTPRPHKARSSSTNWLFECELKTLVSSINSGSCGKCQPVYYISIGIIVHTHTIG